MSFLDFFHKHKGRFCGYEVEYNHVLDNGKLAECPYEGCTRYYEVEKCITCGERERHRTSLVFIEIRKKKK